ncbi:MAG: response regulator transcription factor [Cyanobacteria bacterium HKST-UBA02]|nr:response regulator transcription factor [Cyanobacteria bacterium HKST-UBA02]
MKSRIRVLLADDHRVLREGLKHLLTQNPSIEVIGDYDSAAELIAGTAKLKPDVVLLDYSMPCSKPPETIQSLKRESRETAVIMLTMYDDLAYLNLCLEAGASGYVLKASPTTDVFQAIITVARGGVFIDPAMARKVAERMVRQKDNFNEAISATLSDRESEVLRLVARGNTNKEIGELKNLSEKTVETYRARAMEKLGLAKRSDLLRYALSLGWLDNL